MEKQQLQPILQVLKQGLIERYQDLLSSIVLYGSQARGEATENSDIDVLVILKSLVHPCDEIDKTLDFITQICLDYDVVISWQFVSLEKFESQNSPFLANVKREGVLL